MFKQTHFLDLLQLDLTSTLFTYFYTNILLTKFNRSSTMQNMNFRIPAVAGIV